MNKIKSQLQELLTNYYDLQDLESKSWDQEKKIIHSFITDKRNASLGDSLINFVYSLAKSLTQKKITGIKIPDSLLIEGYSNSKINTLLPIQAKKKDKGNIIEALLFYIWLTKDFSIEEMALNIIAGVDANSININVNEERIAKYGLEKLFDACYSILKK